MVDGLISQACSESRKLDAKTFALDGGGFSCLAVNSVLAAFSSSSDSSSDSSSESDTSPEPAEPEAPTEQLGDPALWSALVRCHKSLGHQTNQQLACALRFRGVGKHVIAAAKNLKCDICLEQSRNYIRRRGQLPKARNFGDVVHLGLIQLEAADAKKAWALNVVGRASRFRHVGILHDKNILAVTNALGRFWLPWAGVPGQFVTDLGPEFRSDEFVAWCEGHGAKVWHASVEAPWQNGLAERAGAIFKGIFRKVVSDHQCSTAVELDFAAATTCVAMNDRIKESGYSP